MAALVIAGCHCPEILEAVNGAFDNIAAFVVLRIETGRTATVAATSETRGFGVFTFLYVATLKHLARLAGAIGPVNTDTCWALFGPS